MASLWQKYHRPASISEALQVLSSAPGPACLIAGGTDLLLELRQGRRSPIHTLVDVSGIPELALLEPRGSELFIGAAVSLTRIVDSPLIHQHALALAEACVRIGGPQVRNVATLGGNVGHALPAADGAIALLALGACAVVASPNPHPVEGHPTDPFVVGTLSPDSAEALTTNAQAVLEPEFTQKRVPLLDLYLGPGKSAIKPDQLLVGFYLPFGLPGQGSAFVRVMRAQGIGLAVLNLGVWLRREQETVADLCIAIGPAGPIPLAAHAVEAIIRGQVLTPDALSAAQAALLTEAHFRTSPYRATSGYRQHVAGNLLVEAVHKAWDRAM